MTHTLGVDKRRARSAGHSLSMIVTFVLLSAGSHCVYAGEQEAAVVPEARARQAMQRGLAWLRGVQKDDGSWSNGNFPALTALGLWAFSRANPPDATGVCARAAAFIAAHARDDGGIYKPAGFGRGSGGLSTYNTAICMVALHAYNRDRYAPLLLKAREFMAGSQLVGDSDGAGGFGYNRPTEGFSLRNLIGWGNRADLSNTGWSLQAMRETQDIEDRRGGRQTVDVNWKSALAYVEKLQTRNPNDPFNDGGFTYERGGERGDAAVDKQSGAVKLLGYGSMTYAGLESMIYAQVARDDPRVTSALAWAGRHWSVDENPGMGRKGLFYYYTIMSKALSLTKSDALPNPDGGDPIPWRRDLMMKLAATQRADGSWINEDNRFWEADPVLVTCYALLSLENALGM